MKALGLRVICIALLALALVHSHADGDQESAEVTANEGLSLVDGLLLSKMILRLPDPYAMLTKPESEETNLVEGTYTSRSEMVHRYVDVAKLLQEHSDEDILTIFRTLDTHKEIFMIPDEAFYEWRLNILARLIYEVDEPAPPGIPASWGVTRWGVAFDGVDGGDFFYPFYFDESDKLAIRVGRQTNPAYGEEDPAWMELEAISRHYPRRDLEKLKVAGTPFTDGRDFDEYPLPPYILPETGIGFVEGIEIIVRVNSLPDERNLLIPQWDDSWESDDGRTRKEKIESYVEAASVMQKLSDAQISLVYRIIQESHRNSLDIVISFSQLWRLNLLSRLIYVVGNPAPVDSPTLWLITRWGIAYHGVDEVDYLYPFYFDDDNNLRLRFGRIEHAFSGTDHVPSSELKYFQENFPRRDLSSIKVGDK